MVLLPTGSPAPHSVALSLAGRGEELVRELVISIYIYFWDKLQYINFLFILFVYIGVIGDG